VSRGRLGSAGFVSRTTLRRKYPLVLWLHGGEGRGSDNVRQISKGNEKGSHVWTTREAQDKLPAFVLAPQCPVSENWAEPETNRRFLYD